MSRSVSWGLLALTLLLTNHAAWAASWSVGSHFGLSTIRSERPGSGSSTVLAWPSNALTYQPAVRVGLSDSSHTHEVVMDSGLLWLDQAGSTLSLLAVTASYQHTFASHAQTAPFASLGAGIYREGGAARSSATFTFGGGIGVRRIVGDRNGVVRAELRADRLHSNDAFGRPALNFLGLRLGFDLWL